MHTNDKLRYILYQVFPQAKSFLPRFVLESAVDSAYNIAQSSATNLPKNPFTGDTKRNIINK